MKQQQKGAKLLQKLQRQNSKSKTNYGASPNPVLAGCFLFLESSNPYVESNKKMDGSVPTIT